MGANDPVIVALEAALEKEPADPALTAHLAGLLLADDRASEALLCCRAALERRPPTGPCWLIPSPIWFVGCLIGVILVGVDVAGRGAVRSEDLTLLALLLAGAVVFGYYGRRWLRARGWA